MAIETLEFGYTVIMLIYLLVYTGKNLEIDSKVMILYCYVGLY